MTNRIGGPVLGNRYPDPNRQTIQSLGNNEARDITGLSTAQLERLFKHLRIPDFVSYQGRCRFSGEEAFLHYIVYNRLGDSKIKMSQN